MFDVNMLDIECIVASLSDLTCRETAAFLNCPNFEVSILFIECIRLRNVLKYLERERERGLKFRDNYKKITSKTICLSLHTHHYRNLLAVKEDQTISYSLLS